MDETQTAETSPDEQRFQATSDQLEAYNRAFERGATRRSRR